jgi:hypothetical protein
MKFRPNIALTSIFILLGVGVTPQAAYGSDPCDQRLQGWTYNADCGEVVEFYTKYASSSTDTISTTQVDVGSQDARIDFHLQIVAPYGLYGSAIMCGEITEQQRSSFWAGEPFVFSGQQTAFGFEIFGSDPSTVRSYFRADGVSLAFPIVIREFEVPGAEVAFELEGHIIMPKGTAPFQGRCQGFHHGSLTFEGRYSGGPEGELAFNVLRTPPETNQGTTSTTPSPQTFRDDSNPWSNLFASPAPVGQASGPVRFPEAVAGDTKMYVNGQQVKLVTKKSSESEIQASTEDGISVVISTTANSSASSSNSRNPGALALTRGVASRIRASGFAPNSRITLWLFSTPTKLSEVRTDAMGEIDIEFTLPDSIETGDHNLQVSGEHIDGSSRDLVLGVSVVEEENGDQNSSKAESGPQDQNQTVLWALGALLLAGLIVAAVVIGRRTKVTKRIPKA